MRLLPAFSGNPLDRADPLRSDAAALSALHGPEARLLKLEGLAPVLDGDALAWSPLAEAPADAELLFLGLEAGQARFAVVAGPGNADPAYAQQPLWGILGRLSAEDLAIYAAARSVLDWHARHRFCACCGQPTRLGKGGWQRDCAACGAQHFPRVDPVAIMLVEHRGKLLLGRQARFPPRAYSALAGFVEPGESVEDTVRREVLEEAGVRIGEVHYLASQAWPFPSQLMLGCLGFAEEAELQIDHNEIEDARWFTHDEVVEALEKGPDSTSFVPPPRQAIARDLLNWWAEERG